MVLDESVPALAGEPGKVFLYPENYLLPELRKDMSPFFSDLMNDVQQSSVDEDAVEAACTSELPTKARRRPPSSS